MSEKLDKLTKAESLEDFANELRKIYSEIHTPEELRETTKQVKQIVAQMKEKNRKLKDDLDNRRVIMTKERGLKIKREYEGMATERRKRAEGKP